MNRGKKSIGLVVGLLLAVGFVFVGRIKAEEMSLLTENGLSNPEYSEYKNKPIPKTGGFYYATPEMTGEESSISSPIPFSKGILTDGDSTTDHRRRPAPYTYWESQPYGTLLFNLKKSYFVSKVRIKLLISGPHGVESVAIFAGEEEGILDAEGARPLAEIKPKSGWNEFNVKKITDKIVLRFTLMEGKTYLSEVEIWGKEADNPVLAKEIEKTGKTEQREKEKAEKILPKIETMQNLAFSGRGTTCWSTFECPNSSYHSCKVFTQEDGSLEKTATWAQSGNYWDCREPLPQVLVVKLPRVEQVSVIRIIWYDTERRCSEYLLEYKDGDIWKMLFNETNNSRQIATYGVNPIKTDTFRMTAYTFEGKNNRLLMRSFQAYDVKGIE